MRGTFPRNDPLRFTSYVLRLRVLCAFAVNVSFRTQPKHAADRGEEVVGIYRDQAFAGEGPPEGGGGLDAGGAAGDEVVSAVADVDRLGWALSQTKTLQRDPERVRVGLVAEAVFLEHGDVERFRD